MKTDLPENKDNKTKPHNVVVPFDIPGKPDIGIFDLNKIFQFNFNFDSLKILLEGLITSYKKTQEELENINAYNKVKNAKLDDLEKKLIDLNILINESLGNDVEVEKLKESKEKQTKENIEANKDITVANQEIKKENIISEKKEKRYYSSKSSKKVKKIHAPINDNIKLDIQVGNDEIINNIIKKINGFDLCIKDLYEAVPLIQKEQNRNINIFNNFEDELDELKSQLNNLYEENNSLRTKLEENEEKFSDIDLKLKEINVIDILKSGSDEVSDKNVILEVISNLDKKISTKIKFIEEKIKKIDTGAFKVEKEAQNIKNEQNLNKRQLDQIKKKIEEINEKGEIINKSLEQTSEDINDKLDTKITNLKKYVKNSLDNLKSDRKNKHKDSNKDLVNEEEQNINLENSKGLKELKESIKEINKKINTFVNNGDFELIKEDISALKSGMNNYVLLPDFKELKDLNEENNTIIRRIKEEFEDFQISQNVSKEITNIKLQLESVSNKVHNISQNLSNKKGDKNNYKINKDDIYKFLEYSTFEEFKSHITKEFSNINDNFNNSKKMLNELIDIVKNRVTFKDLKTLEEAIMSQMENLKILFIKKFADKADVNKAMKYLDQQIKNIIQIYIKKIEKGDNWLLSKKPITSKLCASCESYIGDLNDTNEDNKIYVPWNKYPVKDINDKLYRLGQGYSNMLQILKTGESENKTERNNNNAINMNKTVSGFGFTGKKIKIPNEKKRTIQNSLPKLRNKEVMKKVNSTFSENNDIDIKINTFSDDGDEKPIITKIFKINKEKH